MPVLVLYIISLAANFQVAGSSSAADCYRSFSRVHHIYIRLLCSIHHIFTSLFHSSSSYFTRFQYARILPRWPALLIPTLLRPPLEHSWLVCCIGLQRRIIRELSAYPPKRNTATARHPYILQRCNEDRTCLTSSRIQILYYSSPPRPTNTLRLSSHPQLQPNPIAQTRYSLACTTPIATIVPP